jgi:hypothetical protein
VLYQLQNYPFLSRASSPSPDEVLDFIMGIYTLERVGIGHDSVLDLFGVSPHAFLHRCLPVHVSAVSALPPPAISYRDHSNALTCYFYTDKVGINIKVDLSSVLPPPS